MGEVSFELQAYTISEDAGIVEVCALITGEVGAPLSITLTTQNGTALGKKISPISHMFIVHYNIKWNNL